MEIAKLVLEFVKALIWPLIVLFIALAFREQFRKLLDRLKEVNGGGITAAFGEDVERAQAAAEAAADQQPASHSEETPEENVFEVFRGVADATPEGAVLAAFRVVEQKLNEAVDVLPGPRRSQRPADRLPSRLIEILSEAGLNQMAVVALRGLRVLRNRAAHAGDAIDAEEARSYVDTAELGVRLLNSFIATAQEHLNEP
ncbi:hypothetical protein ACFV6D_23310 [Kitasatospora sp. NPDC059812]|uniref:hypothetical protein n=1 Tax=Kitasatospora sp. NPDC059812 TaxID=3346958 RepID=UPI00364E0422